MAVIKRKKVLFNAIKGKIKPEPFKHKSLTKPGTLQSITAAALVLPGLISQPVHADDEDEVDFQYSHYQEGKRNLFGNVSAFSPIEVDSLHGSAKVKLTDRIKFAFNYTQDTWGGATPISTAPEAFGGNGEYAGLGDEKDKNIIKSGATPLINQLTVFFGQDLQPLMTRSVTAGNPVVNNRLVHTLSQASPETRKQGDFKLSYDWDDASVSAGGGISVENDYESRFGNLGGRMDFNNKLTSVNLGLSYTNSDTHAVVDHDAAPYFYDTVSFFPDYFNNSHPEGRIEGVPDGFGGFKSPYLITGKREDWGVALGISQVLNKNAVLSAGLDYTRSTGYLDNPYKAVQVAFIEQDPNNCFAPFSDLKCAELKALLESRPDVRNQWAGNLGLVQYIAPLDAALHLNYRIFSDDWGITSHTFEADWVQPLGAGWAVTPRIRYYSQDQANFYTPFLISNQNAAPLLIDPEKGQVFYTGSEVNTKSNFYYDDLTGILQAPLDPDGNEIRNPNTGNVVLDANGKVVSDPNIVRDLCKNPSPQIGNLGLY